MVVSTIAPSCWIHLSSVSNYFKNNCKCGNPDLLKQRSKGWFFSKHRFIPKYIKLIFTTNTIWIKFIALYELVIILNEYFAIFYVIFFLKNYGMWLLEGFIIGYSINIIIMTIFNWNVLRKNNLYIPYEVITIQPLIYKIFMITIYRYIGLIYHAYIALFYICGVKKNGVPIYKRLEDVKFKELINKMY